MKMKKLFTLALSAALTLSLAACGGGSAASATKMTMGTGGSAGTYYGYGGVLGQYIKNKAGIDVTVVATDGSKANIQGIAAGDYQLGTVQSDTMSYAWEGTRAFESTGKVDSFRVVAGLYAESVQLVTMDPSIKTPADLKGKAVSIGAPGSGVYFNAIDVLNAAGLTENDISAQYQSFSDSADALKDGKIDAAFVVAGAPTPAITELCTTNSAYLVPIDGAVADAMMASCPFYTTYQIPAGTYPGQDEDVTTVTVKATQASYEYDSNRYRQGHSDRLCLRLRGRCLQAHRRHLRQRRRHCQGKRQGRGAEPGERHHRHDRSLPQGRCQVFC